MPSQTRISPHPASRSKGGIGISSATQEEKESPEHDEMPESDRFEDFRTKIKCETGWLLTASLEAMSIITED